MARAFPGGTLTLIGNVFDPGHYAPLRELANVVFSLGSRRRPQIVEAIMGADACLIPHVKNGLTEAMSPLKLYEYLARGRPVAATDLQPIRAAAEGDRVTFVAAGSDFPPAVRSALAAGPAREADRQAFLLATRGARGLTRCSTSRWRPRRRP